MHTYYRYMYLRSNKKRPAYFNYYAHILQVHVLCVSTETMFHYSTMYLTVGLGDGCFVPVPFEAVGLHCPKQVREGHFKRGQKCILKLGIRTLELSHRLETAGNLLHRQTERKTHVIVLSKTLVRSTILYSLIFEGC